MAFCTNIHVRENKSEPTKEITRSRSWYSDRVRQACIRNELYTRGDNEAYSAMLDYVDSHDPTTRAMYEVAKDILAHSREQTVTNIMFILESEAVITTFAIDGDYEA